MSAIGTLVRGAAAGAVGGLAMDLLWYRRYRAGDGDDPFAEWELSSATSFDDAGAPAQVGRRVAGLVGVDLPDEAAGTTNNVVHWATALGWGTLHALTGDGDEGPLTTVARGTLTGVAAFLTAYGALGAAGIYDPIWEYGSDALRDDLTAHLLFGTVTGVAALALRAAVR